MATVAAPGGGSLIPANARTIYEYLLAHGYTSNAAAGIVGNIYQESGGNPEAGGPGNAGIIQWTPESSASPIKAIMTGNRSRDLSAQLRDVLAYNDAQGNAALQQLNRASSPAQAALIYSNLFERPAAADADNSTRQASAQAVAAAAKAGAWPETRAGNLPNPGTTKAATVDPTGALSAAGGFLHDISVPIAWFIEFWQPGEGWRLAFGAGAVVGTVGGVRTLRGAGQTADSSALPLAIALLGAAALCAFIALRPYPLSSTGKALRPAYVAVETLRGEPPAAGPPETAPVGEVEAGLVTLFGLWAAGKLASGVTALAGGAAAGAGLWSKISGWLGKAGEDLGGDVGEATG